MPLCREDSQVYQQRQLEATREEWEELQQISDELYRKQLVPALQYSVVTQALHGKASEVNSSQQEATKIMSQNSLGSCHSYQRQSGNIDFM